ncbi:hypothetical protein N7470_001793 [Penicillium chermesinum]|nr:hypothetical protein N7470_001793 [Penicillium chermesinum]
MQGQHGPALHWYHALVENVNEQDELDDGLSVKLTRPVLMIFPASLPGDFSVASGQTNEIADDLTVKKVRTSGHWLQLEAKDEVNSMLRLSSHPIENTNFLFNRLHTASLRLLSM